MRHLLPIAVPAGLLLGLLATASGCGAGVGPDTGAPAAGAAASSADRATAETIHNRYQVKGIAAYVLFDRSDESGYTTGWVWLPQTTSHSPGEGAPVSTAPGTIAIWHSDPINGPLWGYGTVYDLQLKGDPGALNAATLTAAFSIHNPETNGDFPVSLSLAFVGDGPIEVEKLESQDGVRLVGRDTVRHGLWSGTLTVGDWSGTLAPAQPNGTFSCIHEGEMRTE